MVKARTARAQLRLATAALQQIKSGSTMTGRWVDARGHCPDGVDEYDRSIRPPGCTWEPFTAEEQGDWLNSVRAMADTTLSRIAALATEEAA